MKTTSLELSKQLKDAGFPQDTGLVWVKDRIRLSGTLLGKSYLAAPTAEEILDRLPERYLLYKDEGKYCCQRNLPGEIRQQESKLSAAEAAGLMYLYLKKENLL